MNIKINDIEIEIPEREGCFAHIYLCSNCKYKDVCNSDKIREQGWCHTFEEKRKEK